MSAHRGRLAPVLILVLVSLIAACREPRAEVAAGEPGAPAAGAAAVPESGAPAAAQPAPARPAAATPAAGKDAAEPYERVSFSALPLEARSHSFIATREGGPPPAFLAPELAANWREKWGDKPATVRVESGHVGGLSCGGKEIALVSPELRGPYLVTRDFGRIKVEPGDLEEGVIFYLTPSQQRALRRFCIG